jgi:hypothetical protein
VVQVGGQNIIKLTDKALSVACRDAGEPQVLGARPPGRTADPCTAPLVDEPKRHRTRRAREGRTSEQFGSGSEVMWPSSLTPGQDPCTGALPVQNHSCFGYAKSSSSGFFVPLIFTTRSRFGLRNKPESIVAVAILFPAIKVAFASPCFVPLCKICGKGIKRVTQHPNKFTFFV